MKQRRRRARLCVTELEGRVVLSTLPGLPAASALLPTYHTASVVHSGATTYTTSSNWSGYAVMASNGAVSGVSGSWTVPSVTGSGTAYSSDWVGIDGYSSSTVEQIGTDSDIVNGKAQYYAWFEMYPNPSYNVPITVHSGDTITASVSYVSGKFTLQITDKNDSTKGSYSITLSAPHALRSSAEWIVEAPSSNSGELPLANFGKVSFSQAAATIAGAAGPINTWSNVAIDMASRSSMEDTTSALSASGNSFTVTYDAPSTPTPTPTPPHRHHHGWYTTNATPVFISFTSQETGNPTLGTNIYIAQASGPAPFIGVVASNSTHGRMPVALAASVTTDTQGLATQPLSSNPAHSTADWSTLGGLLSANQDPAASLDTAAVDPGSTLLPVHSVGSSEQEIDSFFAGVAAHGRLGGDSESATTSLSSNHGSDVGSAGLAILGVGSLLHFQSQGAASQDRSRAWEEPDDLA